jgi:purine catabolism regulator
VEIEELRAGGAISGGNKTMLTIAQALEMEVFASARVVAGESGLEKPIQWIHMVDIPEMAEWSQEGELLFTTAFGLKDNPDLQATLIPDLVEREVVGMVVGVGRYFHDIPEVMIKYANELSFPIIELPWEVPFIEVTRAISENIVRERYELMQQSLQIHNTLTQLVLMGDDLNALAKALAELVQCPVTIEDTFFRLLAYASWGGIDWARQESILQRRTPPALLTELERRGILGELRQSLHPVRIPPLPEQGLTLERIVAPIVAGREVHGYVLLIVEDRPISDLDMIAIEHAATVAALILLKERAVYETEQRLKSSLLDDLLEGESDLKSGLLEKARRFEHSLTQSQQILIFHQNSGGDLSNLSRWMEQKIKEQHQPGLLVERGDDLVLLLAGCQTEEGVRLAHKLWEEGQKEGYLFSVGVGRAYRGWEKLSESYEEAREALEIRPSLLGEEVISFDALGLLYWLRHLPPGVREKNHFSQVVLTLAEHDAQRGGELLKTLETYLDTGKNVQEAAKRLFLHRNTLRQRLSKIETLCDLELNDPPTCLNLHVALKERRLQSGD